MQHPFSYRFYLETVSNHSRNAHSSQSNQRMWSGCGCKYCDLTNWIVNFHHKASSQILPPLSWCFKTNMMRLMWLSVYCVHLHPAFKDLCLEWVSLCDERVIRFHVLHELRHDVSVDSPCKLHFTVTVKICCSFFMFLWSSAAHFILHLITADDGMRNSSRERGGDGKKWKRGEKKGRAEGNRKRRRLMDVYRVA